MPEPSPFPIKSIPAVLPVKAHAWPFDVLHREIDRVSEAFHFCGLRSPFAPRPFNVGSSFGGDEWGPVPLVDANGTEADFRLTAELPGMDEKDIEVRLSDDTLTIRGEKREAAGDKGGSRYCSERRYGTFTRTFQLPHSIDTSKIAATFDKGVLTVTMPKTHAAGAAEKTIEIKVA